MESIYRPLFVHMYNIQIGVCIHPEHQFESKVVLDYELDSKSDSGISNWIGSPP
jgi:hypothetical protein